MDKFILTVIVVFSCTSYINANEEPRIQIFEIRKARDDRDRNEDFRIDTEYYDPDGFELSNKIEVYRANPSKYRNTNVDEVTDNLINKLRRIVQSNNRYVNRNNKDDNISTFGNLKDDREIEDNLKTPVVLVAHKDVLYHIIPQNQRSKRNRQQSALRSENFYEDNMEDRTAPPPQRGRYDYEYEG